ncbi:MAG: 4-hydroxy-3-methylbut-2-enyl diphosphate reductase [Bacteroidales bacterium]|nr:4-hydroxy-3-methylbut-2-enyl diphosphate reductase [Bacteroidales bacterium]MBN2755789.1 4-hydroxy-3-methylbut-2-enyl diphosphate reductase [Bacteroidales bacterium]
MIVEIDNTSGFCFGVKAAINKAEELLLQNIELYCLGQIVHNEMEVERLEELGMKTIDYEEFKEIKNKTVLLRAHGEPPETYEIAKKNNITLIDATCPIVDKFQKKIKTTFESQNNLAQIVLFGKKSHPEVIGLNGQTNYNTIVVEKVEDIEEIDFNKPINLYSQTTKSVENYNLIIEAIKETQKKTENENLLNVNNTLCRQVYGRNDLLKEFAKKYEVLIFVSGKNSSNGNMLFNICKSENKNSYFISDISEIKKEWFENADSVGISGATSTPMWLIEMVRDKILSFNL